MLERFAIAIQEFQLRLCKNAAACPDFCPNLYTVWNVVSDRSECLQLASIVHDPIRNSQIKVVK